MDVPTRTPNVCKVTASWASVRWFWTIILHTFGIQVRIKPGWKRQYPMGSIDQVTRLLLRNLI